MQPIIISGGPGAGKTTLVNALASHNFATFAEAPRTLIEEQSRLDNGILPWINLPGFAALCLDVMSEQKAQASQHPVAFLDRAIPDICGYLSQADLEIDEKYLEIGRAHV